MRTIKLFGSYMGQEKIKINMSQIDYFIVSHTSGQNGQQLKGWLKKPIGFVNCVVFLQKNNSKTLIKRIKEIVKNDGKARSKQPFDLNNSYSIEHNAEKVLKSLVENFKMYEI